LDMTYKSSDIQVLDEVTHIRTNPGMYIGSTSNPIHLIEEVFDNSLDECLGGHASIVAINIDTKKNLYSVIDNGRGIPIDEDTAVTISSKLFSGAKFAGSKTAYAICSGLHGVGLVALNALCKFYQIEIYRGNRYALYTFKNQELKTKEIVDCQGNKPFSTKISFIPDNKIFESLVPDLARLRKRILVASAELPQAKFVLVIDGKKEVINISPDDFFKTHCQSDGDTELTSIIEVDAEIKPEKFRVKFTYATIGATTPRVVSSINILPVDQGGTHVTLFTNIIKTIFITKAKKMGIHFLPQDSLCGLRAYLSLELKTPEFSGQTKDKLINRKSYLDKLATQLEKQIEGYFARCPDKLEAILRHCESYRRKLDAKKIKSRTSSKRGSTKFTKLRDCKSNKGILFITEGASAEGSFVDCRDSRIHAIFPLRGKIPSVANAKDILKNKEIGELIGALGTGVGPHFDIKTLRYDKIICATDADPDGGHIFCLLTIALAMLVPEIIKQGHYYLAQTPLYAISDGKKTFQPIWTEEELKKARESRKSIQRYKGLGELSPWQLKICALDPDTRRWIQVEYSKNMDFMMKLFSDVSTKRKLLEGKYRI